MANYEDMDFVDELLEKPYKNVSKKLIAFNVMHTKKHLDCKNINLGVSRLNIILRNLVKIVHSKTNPRFCIL